MLDQLVTDFADALFNVKSRKIYAEEDADLEAIREGCIHNGMILAPKYVTGVGKYLVKRSSRLVDERRESLLEAAKRAKLPHTDAVFGEISALVNEFCGRQQHREVGFLANHIAHLPGLNNTPDALRAAVVFRIQAGIADLMEDSKNK